MVRLLRTKFWAELHRRGEFTVDPSAVLCFAARRRSEPRQQGGTACTSRARASGSSTTTAVCGVEACRMYSVSMLGCSDDPAQENPGRVNLLNVECNASSWQYPSWLLPNPH